MLPFTHLHCITVYCDKMRLSGLIVLSLVSITSVLAGNSTVRSLVFPVQTSTSYVELVPQKWPPKLQAFTLCMRVATELKGRREVILFAYRTTDHDALNVWRELDGRLSFYLSGSGVLFAVPKLGALQTHLCVTWDSSSGAAAVFMDGKKSLTKIYKKSHTIPSGGKVLLGQDPDSFVGRFDARQSFVGEISDVNMWDSVLPDRTVQELVSRRTGMGGNIFNWQTTQLKVTGQVHVIQNKV